MESMVQGVRLGGRRGQCKQVLMMKQNVQHEDEHFLAMLMSILANPPFEFRASLVALVHIWLVSPFSRSGDLDANRRMAVRML